MVKTSHAGKNPRQQQHYFEVVSHQPTSPTVEDAELMVSTGDSDASLEYGDEVPVPPSARKKRKKSGLNQHCKKYLAVYIIGILTFFGGASVLLYVTLGLPMSGAIERISIQIEVQKELNGALIEDIENLEDEIIYSNSEIQSMFQEINLKLQEQLLKLQFLEQLVEEARP